MSLPVSIEPGQKAKAQDLIPGQHWLTSSPNVAGAQLEVFGSLLGGSSWTIARQALSATRRASTLLTARNTDRNPAQTNFLITFERPLFFASGGSSRASLTRM